MVQAFLRVDTSHDNSDPSSKWSCFKLVKITTIVVTVIHNVCKFSSVQSLFDLIFFNDIKIYNTKKKISSAACCIHDNARSD